MSGDMLGEEFRFGSYYEVSITGDKVLDVTQAKRAKVVKIIGTLTAAAIVVMPRVPGGDWDVINGTTGGFDVEFVGPTGTGVTVGAGTAAHIVDEGDRFTATASSAASGAAPASAVFITGAAHASLTGAKVATTTQTIAYDGTSVGQARWNVTADWGAHDWTSTGTLTIGQIIDSGLTASQYVKTNGSKQLVSLAKIPLTDLDGGSAGRVLYHNGTAWTELAPGTDGHTLTLVGGLPAWTAPSGGGAPTNAQFLVLALDGDLTNERTLAFNGTRFALVDGGANSSYSVDIAAGGITNTHIGAAAAIAGTKIAPAFGAQSVSTTGTVTAGAFVGTGTVASAGLLRGANNSTIVAAVRSDGVTNAPLVRFDGTDVMLLGENAQVAGTYLQANGTHWIQISGATVAAFQSTRFYTAKDVEFSASTFLVRFGASGATFGVVAGSPEGATTAPVGSLRVNTSDGALYTKTSGTGNTGWTVVGGSTGTTVTIRTTAGPVNLTGSGVARRNVHLNRYASANLTYNLPTTGRTVGESFVIKNQYTTQTTTVDAGSGVGHDGPGSLQTMDIADGNCAEFVWDGTDWNVV